MKQLDYVVLLVVQLVRYSLQSCPQMSLWRYPIHQSIIPQTCDANPDFAALLTSFSTQCTFEFSSAYNVARCQRFCVTEPTCKILEFLPNTLQCGICKDPPSGAQHTFVGNVMIVGEKFTTYINRKFVIIFFRRACSQAICGKSQGQVA